MLLEETAENLHGHVLNRINNGLFPPFDEITAVGLEQNPELVFHFLHMMVDHYPAHPDAGPYPLEYKAAYFLFAENLLILRLSLEKKRAWAQKMVAELQQLLVDEYFIAEYGQRFQQDLLDALREAGLEICPALKKAHFDLTTYYSRFWNKPGTPDLEEVLNLLDSDGSNSTYDLANMFLMQLDMSPTPTNQVHIIAGMAETAGVRGSEVLALMLMHPLARVRQTIPPILIDFARRGVLSPNSLWRMIALRNWLPENERPALDQAISFARKARVTCAIIEPARIESLLVGNMDGSGGQVCWIVLKTGKTWLVGHITFKLDYGIREIWIREIYDAVSLAELKTILGEEEALMLPVSLTYFDLIFGHFLAESNRCGTVAPLEALRLVEVLGKPHIHACFLDPETVLADHLLPDPCREQAIIESSDDWGLSATFSRSWIEDDGEIDLLLEAGHFTMTQALDASSEVEGQVVKSIMEPRREQWLRCFIITALWLQSDTSDDHPDWVNFLVLARALQAGLPLSEIPLIVEIGMQTLYAALLRNGEIPFDRDLF